MPTREALAEKLIEATGMRGSVLQGGAGTPLHRPPRSALHSSPFPNSISTNHSSHFFPELNNKLLCHFLASVVLIGCGERQARPLTSGPCLSPEVVPPAPPPHPAALPSRERQQIEHTSALGRKHVVSTCHRLLSSSKTPFSSKKAK